MRIVEQLRFTDITPEILRSLSNDELRELRPELGAAWDASLTDEGRDLPDGLNREEFLNRFVFLVDEITRREISIELDDAIGKAFLALTRPQSSRESQLPHPLDEAACAELLEALPDELMVCEDFVRFGGDFLNEAEAGGDAGVKVFLHDCFEDSSRDLKLSRMVESATNRKATFVLCPDGFPDEDLVEGYDLVLRKCKGAHASLTVIDEPEFQERIYGSVGQTVEGSEPLRERRTALRDALVDFVAIPSYVAVTGSYIYHDADRKPNDIDIVVKSFDERQDIVDLLEESLREATGMQVHWVWEARGPNWSWCGCYDLVCRVRQKDKLDQLERGARIKEAFHLRDTHWLPVPASGQCPMSHPNKLKFPNTETLRCFTDSAARVVRARMREQVEKLTNERSRLRPAREDNPNERCSVCAYFEEPTICRIVEGPVSADLVCDWIDSTGQDPELYKVSDDDWLSFVRGMIEKQPYQHIVKDGAITPAGSLVLIEDTAKPPHRFSLTRPFHIVHTVDSHHWTQSEVDDLVEVGRAELKEAFRIDLTYRPDEEPTHEELEAKRKEILKKFEDFVKAEFPKGDIKVELENLIPKIML